MTQEQFNQDYGRIAMPKPFAHDGLITPIVDIGDSTHPVNFADGFPSEYSTPHSQGGKYVTRGEFNAIGNLATRNDFYRACGGLNTFNAALSSKIGGYPKGAVLQLLDKNVLKYVISLVDNNTVNFNTAGIDGVNWMFCYESKHEEEGEGFLEHIEATDISPMLDYTDTLTIKRVPKNGFISIRNIRVEFGKSLPFSAYQLPCLLGSGILLKYFSSPDLVVPWYAQDTSTDWKVARILTTGTISWRYFADQIPTWRKETFFGSVNGQDSSAIYYTPDKGLIAVQEGGYACIDIANGYSIIDRIFPSSNTSVITIEAPFIKSLSFDIYII